MGNKEELVAYLKKVKVIGKVEYPKIAELFEKVVVEDVVQIWKNHKNKIEDSKFVIYLKEEKDGEGEKAT